eukprot:5382358-Pyramimonas_sp.AAC.1
MTARVHSTPQRVYTDMQGYTRVGACLITWSSWRSGPRQRHAAGMACARLHWHTLAACACVAAAAAQFTGVSDATADPTTTKCSSG